MARQTATVAAAVALMAMAMAMAGSASEAILPVKPKPNKLQRMVVYMHPTNEVTVAGVNGSASSPAAFGTIVAADEVLREGPRSTSAEIGRAQGLFSSVQLKGGNWMLLLSLIFRNAKYNGSTIQIQGADYFQQPSREVSIVGGTGKFRLASGYAVLRTIGNATVNSVEFALYYTLPKF